MKKLGFIIVACLIRLTSFSQVNFSIKSESFTRPDTVVYVNNTPNSISQLWDVSGGKIASSNDLNQPEITVIYLNPGTYTVGLTVEVDPTVFESLIQKDFITTPGIISNDIVFCKPETLFVNTLGGVACSWSNGNTNSNLVDYNPHSGYYVVTISNDMSFVKTMKDSIKVTIASDPGLAGNQNDNYCKGDSLALLFFNGLKSYTLTSMKYDGISSYNPDYSTTKQYSNKNPFYFKESNYYSIEYVDSLNCTWKDNNLFPIGDNQKEAPFFQIVDQEICKGDLTQISTSLFDYLVEWYKNGTLFSSGPELYDISDTGKYVAKAYDFSNTCSSSDSAIISYVTSKPENITSINYLPGIGYVSTYSNNYNSRSVVMYNSSSKIDSISENEKVSYGKLPIIIDTNVYTSAPILHLETYNSCGEKAVSKTFQPIWLNVEFDLQTEGKILTWTKDSINNPLTYYIFRGTKPENMELLTEVASSLQEFTDTDKVASKNAIYAIGVKDLSMVGNFYKAMLLDWQAGFVTSNLSPELPNYHRIGVFAYLQNDKPDSYVYFKAIAPKSDSITWLLETSNIPFIEKGIKTKYLYKDYGLYDVTVKTYTNSVVDSIILKDFINIGDPIYFALDTIYKNISNDTLVVDISKTIKNDIAFLSSNSKVEWNTNAQFSNRLMIDKATSNISDSLLVWINPLAGDTLINISLNGNFLNTYYPSANLTIVVSNKPNQAPSLIKPIPEQVATLGKRFVPIYLPDYIKDDYSQFSTLKFKTSLNQYFTFNINKGFLTIEQTDGLFTGMTQFYLEAIDENGLDLNMTIDIIQPYLVNVPTIIPSASFTVNKQFIEPTNTVHFNSILSSADSIKWNFNGGIQIAGTNVNPTVIFNKAGKYTIVLTAKNNLGSIDIVKTNYIIVTALSPQDTTICKGDSITITVLGSGFTSYLWNTGSNSSTIKVSPSKTTTYKISMKKGLSTVIDSVTISIPKQPELGIDTTFCEGGSLLLKPGTFSKYYWNGSVTEGTSSFEAKTIGKITVKTIDTKGCISKDSITILPLYKKPIVNLGKDSIFCWKKSMLVDAGNAGSSYKWSTGKSTKTISIDTTGIYSVTVTDSKTCVNSDTVSIKVLVPIIPQIGIVTQSVSGKNLIAWEPQLNKGILMYHVWRETNVTGQYTLIGTNAKDSLTVSIDQASNPKSQSNNYVLSTVDSACGNESYKSKVHSSIHLSCRLQTDGTVKASWNNYNGISVLKYIIYRAKKGETLMPYDTILVKQGLQNIEYIDLNAIGLNSYYQVGFDLSKKLTPSKLKSDSGPFSQSLSNMAESELTEISEVSKSDVTISPNPTNSKIMVSISTQEKFNLTILDLLGRKILTKEGIGSSIVDCAELKTGVYIIVVQSENINTSQKLIKE